MQDPRINLLEDKFDLRPNPKPNPWLLGRYFFGALLLGACVGVGVSFLQANAGLRNSTESESGLLGIFRDGMLPTTKDRSLEGEETDRINVLLLGVGGLGHDGGELADTIIFGSIKPSEQKIGVMSIPRDLTIPMGSHGWRKINYSNYLGELEREGGGLDFSAGFVGDVLGQEIPYVVRVDFSGFETLINALGGVDVYVERSFTDTSYPTSDHLTQTIQFEEGWHHMDGKTALQFARSRHGNNGEGSDFARSRRQQKILLAVKNEALSAKTFLNPKRITQLLQIINDHVDTNLHPWEMIRLATFAKDVLPENINHHVLAAGPDEPLYETNVNGAYVILPDNDDWGPVRHIASNLFEHDPGHVPYVPVAAQVPTVRIAIENGTSINGLAFRTSQLLEDEGYNVTSIANAATRDWDHTVIYDLSEGQYPEELRSLKDYLQADISTTVRGWLSNDEITPRSVALENEGILDGREGDIDFLVVLGQSATSVVRN